MNLDHERWLNALCLQYDPEMFFEPGREIDALLVCQRCPLRYECREYAIANRIPFGVWGGTTQEGRRGAGARKRRKRCPDCKSGSIRVLSPQAECCDHCGLSWAT